MASIQLPLEGCFGQRGKRNTPDFPTANCLKYLTYSVQMSINNIKRYLANIVLFFFGVLVALLIAEFVSRIVFPISPGLKWVTLDGQPIPGLFVPNSVYRQVADEYNVITSITEKGHRVPRTNGNPEVVFLGDSFTFGHGLGDEETFPFIYCRSLGFSCANLGAPELNTRREIDRLEDFMDRYGWRPNEVKLFIYAMTTSLAVGNDLADAGTPQEQSTDPSGEFDEVAGEPLVTTEASPSLLTRIVNYRNVVQRHSNLFRIVKFVFGPQLKSLLLPELEGQELALALEATRQQFERLDRMSQIYDFQYEIYLFHPVQDITRGTAQETFDSLSEISPVPIYGTAHLFEDNPTRYYFKTDLHFNPEGSRKIAEFLIDQDKR